ncbi:MAG: metal ABC transporter substrate-binding protein [Bacillus subtilis]|nr:metal ABC transporter substrate-binding protein [Bacillus subtilis]
MKRRRANGNPSMKPLQGRQIITFHRSWTYFAAWLNITVAGTGGTQAGRSAQPEPHAAVIDLARKGGIKAIAGRAVL